MTNGTAYGFFKYSGTKQEVEAELPYLLNDRSNTKTPSELEITVIDDFDQLNKDSGLRDTAQEAKSAYNYALKAEYKGGKTFRNSEAARELTRIFQQMSQCPLYEPEIEAGKEIDFAVLYEEDGKYYFAE